MNRSVSDAPWSRLHLTAGPRSRHRRRVYEDRVGLRRAPASPPGAVVFASEPMPFAVREPLPETDLDCGQPGLGITLWLKVDDAQALHDQLAGRGVTILTDPFDGSFGRTFALRDPDGYTVTIHDAAK